MAIDTVLQSLDKVRRTGPDKWIACCPSHDDRDPSLSISDNDGTVLVHCFAGCSFHEIASGAGLEPSDFFPEKPTHYRPSKRPRISAADALRCLSLEAAAVYLAAYRLADGGSLLPDEVERLKLAYQRISAAQEVVNAR